MTVDNERYAVASLREALTTGLAKLTPSGGICFPRCDAHDEAGAGATLISEHLTLLGIPHEVRPAPFPLTAGSSAPGAAPTVAWDSLPALSKWIPDLPTLMAALDIAAD